MSSAIRFNLDQFKILLFGKELKYDKMAANQVKLQMEVCIKPLFT